MIVKDEGFKMDLGAFTGVAVGLIDIGTRDDPKFKKRERQAIIKFELPELTYDDNGTERRRTVNQFYPLKLTKGSKLRTHLTGWRGKEFTSEELDGFELRNILGTACVPIFGKNKTETKTVITDITKYRGQAIQPEHPLEYFSFEEFEGTFPEWMTDGIKGLCEKSDEYLAYFHTGNPVPSAPADDPDPAPEVNDDIPF